MITALRSLETIAEQEDEADGIGWRYRDLPLLYQNMIYEEWQRTQEIESESQWFGLDPNTTNVFWCKNILVSLMLQQEDGSGGGMEIAVPVF
jgi:hypothetical protein